MLLRRVAPATTLPVTVAEARQHLREPDVSENGLIETMIAAACDMVAEMTGRVLVAETWEAAYPAVAGDLKLPKSPVLSVTSIGFYDAADAPQVAELSGFYVFTDDDTCTIRPKSGAAWPSTIARADAITVTFQAGYAVLPPALRSAILLTMAHLYEHRESVVIGAATVELPLGIQSLINLHRLGWAAG